MGVCLDEQQIADHVEYRREQVDTPEWGEGNYVMVRPLTLAEQDTVLGKFYAMDTGGDAKVRQIQGQRALIAAYAMVNEDGKQIFHNVNKGCDILGKRNAEVVTRIAQKAMEISGLAESGRDELEKNSARTLLGNSDSCLPEV